MNVFLTKSNELYSVLKPFTFPDIVWVPVGVCIVMFMTYTIICRISGKKFFGIEKVSTKDVIETALLLCIVIGICFVANYFEGCLIRKYEKDKEVCELLNENLDKEVYFLGEPTDVSVRFLSAYISVYRIGSVEVNEDSVDITGDSFLFNEIQKAKKAIENK